MERKRITWQQKKAQVDQHFTTEELTEMDKRIALANLIITERNKRGWTQEQLAQNAGLHQVQIARIESGERMPSFKTLSKIAAAFNMMVGFVPVEKSQEAHSLPPTSNDNRGHSI